MNFDELDRKMRVYETAHDHCVLPGLHMVARLDGRSFTRLVRDVHAFEAPFDLRFHDLMVETVRHLMQCGFDLPYGYTESDEISLLFRRDESSFGRKLRKLTSVLAGEASAKFSLMLLPPHPPILIRAALPRVAGLGLERRAIDLGHRPVRQLELQPVRGHAPARGLRRPPTLVLERAVVLQ